MIDKVKECVYLLLKENNDGHGMEHINRVLELSLKFADIEHADKDITALIALLHDVDDYKLFGIECSEKLTNAKKIMKDCAIDTKIQEQVILSLKNFGYGKRLNGCYPTKIEGKVVSDADMCDGLGVSGILRTHAYGIKHNRPFFDKNIFPIEDMTAEKYTRDCADSSVCHIFEKILKLKDLMLTDAGKKEAESRYNIVVEFLYHLFAEENATEWIEYLDNYLKRSRD